jgi:3-deoxy-7-phosphoheptulonate synthase
MEEFLLAAEYILDRGNHQVILCERGIRTFETHTRFTLAAGERAVPEGADAPAGRRSTRATGPGLLHSYGPMCAASVACGADGLIIEVHPDPKKAKSDASQTISPEAFAATMAQCRAVAGALGRQIG